MRSARPERPNDTHEAGRANATTGAPAPGTQDRAPGALVPARRRFLQLGGAAMLAALGTGLRPRTSAAATGPAPPGGRVVQSLNGTWDFQPSADAAPAWPPPASGWATIPVPAEWNMTAGTFATSWDAYDIFKTPPTWDSAGAAWYRRAVTVPAKYSGSRIVLRFEAVNFESTVYWNGIQVAHNTDGLMPFEADVTGHVTFGGTDTVHIAVRAPGTGARAPDGFHFPCGSWWGQTCGGIWQDVWLLAIPAVHVADTAVQTSVRRQQLAATATLANSGPADATAWVTATVWDGASAVQRMSAQVTVPAGSGTDAAFSVAWPQPHLWTPDDPHLYELQVDLRESAAGPVTDSTTTRFGFREVWVDGPVIYLSGEPVTLRGDAWHYMGSVENSRAYAGTWFQMAKAAGVNYIRLHAMPYPPVFYDVADEMGMLIVAESGVYGSSINYAVNAADFWDNCAAHLTRRVKRDRNHPSVFAWSAENEMLAGFGQSWSAKVAAFKPVITAVDGSRPVYFEGDGDPQGAGDIQSTHYPLEITTQNTAIPETAYAFAPGGSRASAWNHQKPFTFGEFSSMYYANPSDVSAIGGPDTYASLDGLWNAHGRIVGAQIEGFRYAGISGISPWNTVWYGNQPLPFQVAKESLPLQGESGGPRVLQVGEFAATLNPGFEKDLPPWQANAIHQAVARVFQPTAALAKDYRTHFWSGGTVSKNLAVYHAAGGDTPVTVSWWLHGIGTGQPPQASKTLSIPAGGGAVDLAATLTAPTVSEVTRGTWRVTVSAAGEQLFTDSAAVTIYPKSAGTPALSGPLTAAVLDTTATSATSNALSALGVSVRSIPDLSSLPDITELLVIGEGSTVSATPDELQAVTGFVQNGGRVLVLAQQVMPQLLPWPATAAGSTQTVAHVAAPHHPVLAGIGKDDLRWWHTTNETVITSAIVKPRFGSLTSLADAGPGLAMSALAEAAFGAGTYLLCQFPVIAASGDEPIAAVLLRNILTYLAGRAATGRKRLGVVADASASKIPATLSAAEVAAAAITTVDAGSLASVDILLADAAPGNESSLAKLADAASAVRTWIGQGGTLWVNGLQPSTVSTLSGVLPPGVTLSPVDAAHQQGAVVTGQSAITDGLNNADVDWPGSGLPLLQYTVHASGGGTTAVSSRAVNWSALSRNPEQTKYGAAMQSTAGFAPGSAVWTVSSGSGRVVIDQLGWPASLPLPAQTAIAAALSAGLGAGFSAGSGSGLIPTTNWKPFTNPNSGGAGNAYDRIESTRWSSNAVQQVGMYYGLDLGAGYKLTRIIWDTSPSPGDYPRGADVEVSFDNVTYTTALSIPDTTPYVSGGVMTLSLNSVNARYIKIVDTKAAAGLYLSVHELYIYGSPSSS